LATLALLGIAAGYFVWIPIYRQAVTDAGLIESKLVVQSAKPSVILASDGKTELYHIAMVQRTVVPVATLPKHVRYAIIAAEDRRFYTHQGVDFTGLMRVSFLALRDHRASQGGSTIEMQLAKKLVNGDARNFQRKLKDIATAQQIERLKTKDQIIDLYMNEVYFGEGAYGIEAAAETYFGKHASKLDIAEAAMLARCIKSPSRVNPIRDPQGALDGRNYVLQVMRDEGWINDKQFEHAYNEEPKLDRYTFHGVRWIRNDAGYFVDHVLKVFHDDFPGIDLQEGGYTIKTTLNWKLQQTAVQAIAATLREHHGQGVTDAAIVVINDKGEILAEVGGPGYAKNKYNIITSSKLQPGSSFKPIVYAAALKEGVIQMGDSLSNEAIYEDRFGNPWNPKNNGRERIGGYVSFETAFKDSINLPAIHTLQKIGAEKVIDYARDTFGLTKSLLPPFESLAIGTGQVYPLEMVRAYSVFMLRGDRVDPYPISEVVAPDGDSLKVYEPNRVSTNFDPAICDDIDQLMRAVVESGTGTAAGYVPDARGKTGTTQDAKDAWFDGYSDNVLGVGWVGNMQMIHGKPTALPMRSSVFGGTVTAGMWAKVLAKAHDLGLCHAPPPPPDRVASAVKPRVKPPRDTVTLDPPDDSQQNSPDDNQTAPNDTPPSEPDPVDPPKPKRKPRKSQEDQPSNDQDDGDKPKVDPPRVRKASNSDDDSDSNMVTVLICADTGMKASKYCPETVSRRYVKGTEPHQICRLHTGR
jgi:penicillin-binding protein 1A